MELRRTKQVRGNVEVGQLHLSPAPSVIGRRQVQFQATFCGPCALSSQGHCAPKRGSTANFDPPASFVRNDGRRLREIGIIVQPCSCWLVDIGLGTIISIKYTLCRMGISPWSLGFGAGPIQD